MTKQSTAKGDDAHKKKAATRPKSDDKNRIAELEAQVAKLTDIAARAQADLQNFKQRAERDKEELRSFATVSVLSRLLPAVDDFFRLGTHLEASEGISEGYGQLSKKFETTLAEMGLQRIQALGTMVDPHKHEVLNISPGEKDIITAVYEDGYELNGKVLRPAKVQAGDGSE